MKFQKGLLHDLKKPPATVGKKDRPAPGTSKPSPVLEDRLFQTHRTTSSSGFQYLKLLGIVSVLVVIAGAAVFYLTLPDKGDQVRAPKGLEEAVRNHFLDVEKRNAGGIIFYFCETYYWARVEVEKRPDIKTNPIHQIGSYAVQATNNSDKWDIKAIPITDPTTDQACGQ